MTKSVITRISSASCLALLFAACDAGPTETTVVDPDLLPPVAAVRAPIEALPFWARGPLCCFDDYAVIYFYVVDPSVVPADFNFLDFFDFRALGAEFAVEGFAIRENADDPVPRKTNLHDIAPVPFWFFPSSVLNEVAADGFVSVTELDREEVIVGYATHFVEELHPSGGTAEQVQLTTSAKGELDSGGDFHFTLSIHINPNTGKINSLINGSLKFD